MTKAGRIVGLNRWDFSRELQRFGPTSAQEPLPPGECQSYCRWIAETHYENFQIASRLLPRPLRPHFHNIYAYCRWSDDLADEAGSTRRATELLAWWQEQLDQLFAGGPATHPVMQALQGTIVQYRLPKQPFADLLSAFLQDQSQFRYDSTDDLINYCQRSANPVGRLVLGLAGAADDAENLRLSDSICTGLQLANFCQDLHRDAGLNRIYVPRELWARHGVDESMLIAARVSPQLQSLLQEFVRLARGYLEAGQPLARRVPRWLSLDVRLFRAGGLAILKEIERARFDVWTRRPTVTKLHKIRLLLRELIRK